MVRSNENGRGPSVPPMSGPDRPRDLVEGRPSPKASEITSSLPSFAVSRARIRETQYAWSAVVPSFGKSMPVFRT